MFDQIFFTQVQLPTPVTPAEIERQMSRNVQNLQEKENGTQEELPANMRNADYFIFGKMDTFSRPPVTDFALENLFYMEAFSIFTCPKGFFTNRKDYQSFLIITHMKETAFWNIWEKITRWARATVSLLTAAFPICTARRGMSGNMAYST